MYISRACVYKYKYYTLCWLTSLTKIRGKWLRHQPSLIKTEVEFNIENLYPEFFPYRQNIKLKTRKLKI